MAGNELSMRSNSICWVEMIHAPNNTIRRTIMTPRESSKALARVMMKKGEAGIDLTKESVE
jgi:hypothetical protein